MKTPPSTGGGAFILDEQWIAVDPFMLKTKLDDGIATLQELALAAFDLEHAWPWYSYLIVSVEQGKVADAHSWRLAEDRSRFEPEELELESPDAVPEPERRKP